MTVKTSPGMTGPSATGMTRQERRTVFSLAGIFGLRLFGLFMLLPVLAIYATGLEGSTPALIGLALGAYGATQAILQIPFGMLSDRLGRKPVIVAGLLIFALGSVIAALADDITGVIIGRAIQGGGAVSSAILALTADLTREEQRTKAMALIGVSIGFVFLLSLMIAPPLQQLIGVDGLFWLTAVLALAAILLLLWVVPSPSKSSLHRDIQPVASQIMQVLRIPALLRLDLGIFTLHTILTALFVVLPVLLQQKSGWGVEQHWKIYLPVLLLSVLGMLPFVILGSKRKLVTQAYRGAIGLMVIALLLLGFAVQSSFAWLLLSVWVFFSAFNALESMLPSLVSRVAPVASKGTALGVYNSAQFFGIFVGGVSGGILSGMYGAQWVALMCAGLTVVWLMVAMLAAPFKLAESRVVSIASCDTANISALIEKIRGVDGVEDVTIIEGETVAYLKVDSELFNHAELAKQLENQIEE